MIRSAVFVFLVAASMAFFPEHLAAGPGPTIIAHRGASGYRPEHTIEAYAMAVEQGADFIEPDLVSTKDGELICRHESALALVDPATGKVTEATTNVADRPEFAGRRRRAKIDGKDLTGWFAEDFTLAEVKTLRARERLHFRDQKFNDKFAVATFQELIDLAKRESRERGRVIGVHPETKHSTYHRAIGLPLEEKIAEALKANGYAGKEAPVIVQSFEVDSVKRLRELTDVRLVQLIDAPQDRPPDFAAARNPRTYADLMTPQGLAAIAKYADGIAPTKRTIVPADKNNRLLPATSLVSDAHAAGLFVHAWTFRNESRYLAADYEGDPAKEYEQFIRLGVDGIITDFPDTATTARSSAGKRK